MFAKKAAMKMGTKDVAVRRLTKKSHVNAIIKHWVNRARANMLHGIKNKAY